jgi:hypothetical protein
MSLAELARRLEDEGVSPHAVSIDGSVRDDTYCLVETPAAWEYFFSERGQRVSLAQFKVFVEAAAHFLGAVLGDPTTRQIRPT